MNPPNFYCNICSEASTPAAYPFQFLGFPRLGIELGEGAPAFEAAHGVLLGHVAPCQGAQLDVVEFYAVHWLRLAVFHYGLLEEVREGAGHDLLHMQEPQQGAHALAGGEGYILNELALLVDGVPVARSTAVAVVVEPLCF